MDDDDDSWDEGDDDEIEPEEIDNWIDAWPSCCGARMVHIADEQQVSDRFPSVTLLSDKCQAWQNILNDADFGFLAIDKPYEGLTELVPGFWYFAGPSWIDHPRSQPTALALAPTFWILYSYQLFRDVSHGLEERTNKFNLITNFPYVHFDITKQLTKQLDEYKNYYNFVILAEDQIGINEPILLKYGFKVANRFLNPYHDGTECALYLRQPGDL